MAYSFSKIESKWQKRWEEDGVYIARNAGKLPKKYVLIEFAYPSGEGLHVGHLRPYVAGDVYSRFLRMQGHEVLYPMGWDAFGLPAENFAIKHGVQPAVSTAKNIANAKRQAESWGIGFDWSREVNTTDPKYYKWTQWIFLQLFKAGLAYEAKGLINWCPKDKTGLANEEVQGGVCERCGTKVEQKEMRQWYLKITAYAEKLLDGLKKLDWPEFIKLQQANWIGKSEGAEINFEIEGGVAPTYVLLHGYTGSPSANFFPWLKKELEMRGAKVYVPKLPHSENPRVSEQVAEVLKTVPFDENTVVVGHSLGGVVAMKILEQLKKPVRKTVFVASFTENKFLDELFESDVFDWKFDIKKIKANAGEVHILRDITDDTVPQFQADNLKKLLGGAITSFAANEPHICAKEESEVLRHCIDSIQVFTTRPDTLFGATFMVISPELAKTWLDVGWRTEKNVQKYVSDALRKRGEAENKDKTGVFSGVHAVNPANKEKIPVWISDYVLHGYGTGAIMAVPAHDERDFEFAKKYKLPIKEVVLPNIIDKRNPPVSGKKFVERKNVHAIVKDPRTGKYLALKWKKFNWTTFPMGGLEAGEDAVSAARREVKEETGFVNLKLVRVLDGDARAEYFAAHKNENRISYTTAVVFELIDHERAEISPEERDTHEVIWLDRSKLNYDHMTHAEVDLWSQKLFSGQSVYAGVGVLKSSGKFDGMDSEKAKWEIIKSVGGKKTVQYKLRDWVFSRQRYWGEPIPLIHCEKCGVVAVRDEDLPVLLPNVKKYEPTGTGESPLAAIDSWVNVKCPECGGPAKRETNTMPQWAGSSWYYLRYIDPHNENVFADKKLLKQWLPVDVYFGGLEHTTLHLLYSRFWHEFLFDKGFVPTPEPYAKRVPHGIILGSDGEKMSKSRGNVLNPDEIVKEFGADALRMYELFLGPHEAVVSWNERGIMGIARFLDRAWKLFQSEKNTTKQSAGVDQAIHQTIKKVSDDISEFKFNTAVSSLMILLNVMEGNAEGCTRESKEIFLKLLAPFAPHITEELWRELGNKDSVHKAPWPVYNPKLAEEASFELVIQINGKVRDTAMISKGVSQDEAERVVLQREIVKKWIGEQKIKKTIFVKDRLINFIV